MGRNYKKIIHILVSYIYIKKIKRNFYTVTLSKSPKLCPHFISYVCKQCWDEGTQCCQTTVEFNHLLDVIPGLELLQQEHGLLGLLVALNFVINHQWDLRDFLNTVS